VKGIPATVSKRLTYGKNQAVAAPESAWRKRKDAWEHLGYMLSEISSEHQDEPGRKEHELEAGRLLGLLASIEPYWANPGLDYFNDVAGLMSTGRYADAMQLVYQANQSFRTITQYMDLDGHDSVRTDPEDLGGGAAGGAKPHVPMVEILLLDNGPTDEIGQFTEELAAQRQRTDPFHYNFIVVPSVEDALAAVLINPSIQGVVLTARFELATRRRLSSTLHKFIVNRTAGYFESTRQIQRLLDLEEILVSCIRRSRST